MTNLEKATVQVKKCLTMGHGGAKAEAEYSRAYAAEAAEGKRLPLKKKYRGG